MTYFDEARSIKGMLDMKNMTQAKLAGVLGVSQPYIANKLRLLNFSPEIEKKIIEAELSERHARAILRLNSDEQRLTVIEKIKTGKLNVERTEIAVDCMLEESFSATLPSVNFAERIGRFEDIIEKSLATLRSFGICARAKTEKHDDKLYISISIG